MQRYPLPVARCPLRVARCPLPYGRMAIRPNRTPPKIGRHTLLMTKTSLTATDRFAEGGVIAELGRRQP